MTMRLQTLCLLTCALLIGAGSAQSQPPKAKVYTPEEADQYTPKIGRYGGTLRLATISDPKSFNPITAKETSTTDITNHIFEGLTRVNGISGMVEPNLAKSWEVSDDGLTYTFHLREDVKWSDGVPFTARDVVFTYRDVVANKGIPTSARDILTVRGRYPEVSAPDDHTVRFTLGGKFAPFPRTMGMEIVSRHKLKPILDKGAARFNEAWSASTDPSEIVGTGPFTLQTYEPSQRVVLKRNPLYWRRDAAGNKLPYLDRLLYMVVKGLDVALLRFKEGRTDVYSLRGEDYDILQGGQGPDSYFIYLLGPSYGQNFLCLNQNRGRHSETGKSYVDPVKLNWFTNVKFRRAIAYAMDRESMISIANQGFGYVQHGPMSPRSGFFYNPDVRKYEYNPARAKELLASEGFSDRDGDGLLEDRGGHPVKFTILTNSGNTVREKIAEMIVKDLRDVGMDVNFTLMEFNALVNKLDATFNWEAIILGFTGGAEPHFGRNIWWSGGHLHMWYPQQEQPATPWEARIDEIFDLGVSELDTHKRKALYGEWQEIVARQLPLIYTVLPESIAAVRNRLGNLAPAQYGGVLHNVEELYFID